MSIIFLVDWLAKKSVNNFAISEKILKNFESYLHYMSETDPNKISLTIEQAVVTCFMLEDIKNSCFYLLSEQDQREFLQIVSNVLQSTNDLKEKYPEAFSVIAADLASNQEKKDILKKFFG